MARPKTDDGRSVTLSLKVSDETAAALREACAEDGLSPSAALNEALLDWLSARTMSRSLAARFAPRPDPSREVPFSSAGRQ